MKYNYYNLLIEPNLNDWGYNRGALTRKELEWMLYSLNDILTTLIPINCKMPPYKEEKNNDNIHIFNEKFDMKLEIKRLTRRELRDLEYINYPTINSVEFIYIDEKEALHSINYSTNGTDINYTVINYKEVIFEKDSIDFLELGSMNLKEKLESLLKSECIYPDYTLLAKADNSVCSIYDYQKINGLEKRIYTYKSDRAFSNLISGIEQYKNEETKNKVFQKILNKE